MSRLCNECNRIAPQLSKLNHTITPAALNRNNSKYVRVTYAVTSNTKWTVLLRQLITLPTISQYHRLFIYDCNTKSTNKQSALRQNNIYPCTCLCLGFSQITLILPFLLITLHFSQIGFTDALTFTVTPSFQKVRFLV